MNKKLKRELYELIDMDKLYREAIHRSVRRKNHRLVGLRDYEECE